jgi:hypothetical protein
VISDPNDEIVAEGPVAAAPVLPIAASLFDDEPFSAGENQHLSLDGASANPDAQDLGCSAPLESFFDNEALTFANEIDRKIDEALELAEKLKNPTGLGEVSADDELDVPAFLRNGLKDMPIS